MEPANPLTPAPLHHAAIRSSALVARRTPSWRGRLWDLWGWYEQQVPDWAAFFLPVLLLAVPPLVLAPAHPSSVGALLTIELVLVTPGLDVGLAAGILSSDFEWWVVLLTGLWVQLLVVSWLVRNLAVLYRWGPTGRFLRRRESKALDAYHRRPWLRRFHFLGVMVFVFLPLNSGIFTGVFVGKLTGLSDRKTLSAVYLGTVVWAALLVLGLTLLEPVLGPWVRRLVDVG